MTAHSSTPFRWWVKALLAFGLLAGLGLFLAWFLTTAAFWQQVGWRLVAGLQDRVNAEVRVERISGNLVTGMVFHGVKITQPQGDTLRVQQLEVSLSLLSFLKLQPVIRTLIFRQPQLYLRQNPADAWNVANLFKNTPPPPFSQIRLARLQVLNGSIRVDRPGEHQNVQDLNVQLDLTIQAPGRPQASVQVRQASVGFTAPPYPAVQAELTLDYADQEIRLDQSSLSLNGYPVLKLQGKLANLTVQPEIALDLKIPALTGPQLHQLWPAWPAALPFQADLQAQGSLGDLQVNGQGDLRELQWQITGRWRQPPSASPEYHLALTFRHLTGAVLAAGQPRSGLSEALSPVSGVLSLNGSGLPWPPAALQARLELQPFTWRQARYDAAVLTAKLEKDRLQHLALKLQGNFGRLEAETNGPLGQLRRTAGPSAGELKIQANGLNPALLLGGQAPPGLLDLKFIGDFQAPRNFDWSQARVAGRLQAAGKVQDYTFQELSAQGSWEAGEVRLNPARLVMSGLRAEAQGRLSAADADLKLALDLSPPGPWPLLPPDLKGQFRVDGAIKGPWQSLAYQMHYQGKALSWRQLALASVQGKASGAASREAFTLSSFDLVAQKLATPLGLFGQIQGQGQTRGADLVFNLKASQAPGQSGLLAGSASWDKNSAQIRLSQFRWGPPDFQILAAEPMTLSLAPGRFEISPLHLRYRQTLLSLSGRLSQEDLSLSAKLDNLQLSDLARLFPDISFLQGTIAAQADLSGSSRSPILKGQLKLTSGRIETFSFDSFQTDLHYQNNVLSLNGRMVEKPDRAKLAWQGTAPLTFTLWPWSWHLPDSGLQLRAWSDNLNLSLFSQLIPGVSAADGPMQLQTQITGGWRQPLLAGAIRFGPGSLTIRPSGAPLAIEPGEIRLDGDRLQISRFLFRSGEGTGEITGGASIESFSLRDVNLQLLASNLLIIRKQGSRAVANGKVSLTGSWPNFRSDGHLTVNDAQFRPAFFTLEKHSDIVLLPRVCVIPVSNGSRNGAAAVERNFTVNLVIDAPGGVWLRDKDINVEIEGQIKVLRQPPGPSYLGGGLKAKQGTFTVNNKIFTLERAALNFPGQPHKPILLDARAARQVDEYTLYVVATGPVDNPRTRLESNPPLPPRDQLSLMVFDHLADKMTREEYITATQKAMGLVGSLTAQKLKSLLGDQLPFLGDVSPTTSQESLGVGKKLGKGITVSYERKMAPLQGEDVNQIRLDYKFNKYFSAESQLGRKNTGGDLFFNIDF